MLVAVGASLTKSDYQGNTPRLQALKADDKELAAYLESKYTQGGGLVHLAKKSQQAGWVSSLQIDHYFNDATDNLIEL